MALLKVRSLKIHYPAKRTADRVKAVDGVSFAIEPKQTIGIVGESRCGKSTIVKALLGLTKITSGIILFQGKDITNAVKKNRSPYRKNIQMIFQDSCTAFNPQKSVPDIIAEPLRNYEKLSKAEKQNRIDEVLALVGLSSEDVSKHPSELSPEQRLRISIARAIALKPKLIIMDDPVSALDLSAQAQILNLIKDLQKKLGFAYIFASHDLSAAHYMCERLAIMHNSRFVELGTKEDIFENPTHIYTKRLVAAMPVVDPAQRDETAERRNIANTEYENLRSDYYKNGTDVYNLKPLSDTHFAALLTV